ncbi:hypothetical protein T01_13085 [Trichinella spiralis]|uniref:Uncharacterized protein n=1 Tax=Trichinella spiralis TaxID=6334 RepID=A0A0V1BF65_TRISP|nr:hypothetical protein T01_13085 [Trichinella spiralis]
MRVSDQALVKFDNAFVYTCGNDVTASRSDAQLYRELELPPNLLKAREHKNLFFNYERLLQFVFLFLERASIATCKQVLMEVQILGIRFG